MHEGSTGILAGGHVRESDAAERAAYQRRGYRLVRRNGFEPDLPAEQIDELFHAALAVIKGNRKEHVELSLRTGRSSLSSVHGLPKWLKS